jgi:tripartite ATP-independent transporter DctM subunit
MREALDDTSVILFIIAAASLYGWLLARYQIPSGIAERILAFTQDPMTILLLVNVFLLVVGCFMESLAAINILTPILLPLVMKVGIDPLHFGVVMVLNLMIGLLTPPVGMVLFAVQRVSGVPFDRLQRALFVYFIPLLLVLLLITVYSPLVTWLPSTLWRK